MNSPWIEAMRLRSLPVSLGGVICALGLTASVQQINWIWGAICLVFAILAQIASNFANEYFDCRDGIDGADRTGPARGIIPAKDMLCATLITLALACAVGLLTLIRGSLWLFPVGIAIALGAMAYSAGPYPFSRHCLGEVAVVVFFGIVPVCLTYYLQTLVIPIGVFVCSVGIGLMGAMVVLVNNYRDIASDSACGKHSLSTVIGHQGSALLYCAMGQFAAMCLWFGGGVDVWGFLPVLPAILGFIGSYLLHRGLVPDASTRLLAVTAMVLLLTSCLLLLTHLII